VVCVARDWAELITSGRAVLVAGDEVGWPVVGGAGSIILLGWLVEPKARVVKDTRMAIAASEAPNAIPLVLFRRRI
jgi:hypothetical protein